MENFITREFENFIIFRLPTVLGDTTNPHTLFNFFIKSIIGGVTIPVHTKACRYLLDVDDVAKILPYMIDNANFWGQIVNIAFDKSIAILDMIEVFEQELKLSANVELLDKGQCFMIDNKVFMDVTKQIGFKVDPENNINVIKKYCRKSLV